jgi:hypothetical protein
MENMGGINHKLNQGHHSYAFPQKGHFIQLFTNILKEKKWAVTLLEV